MLRGLSRDETGNEEEDGVWSHIRNKMGRLAFSVFLLMRDLLHPSSLGRVPLSLPPSESLKRTSLQDSMGLLDRKHLTPVTLNERALSARLQGTGGEELVFSRHSCRNLIFTTVQPGLSG